MRKWFGNLKIAYKLSVSFLFVTSLVLIIGAVGIINLSVLVKHQEYLLVNFQTTVTTDNQQNDGASAATPQSDATSSATITADKVNNDIRNSKITIYVMSGIVVVSIIISILLGTYISRLIGEPMKLFAEYAKMLAVGDVAVDKVLKKRNVDGRLLSRKDEFGELAVSFERVIGSTKILAEQTQNIASGDLTTEVTVRSGADILGQALREMVLKFHELTTSIIATSEQVSDGAAVVSGSSAALSQGASVQASSIQQLSAAIEEISAQTLTNAQNARTASQLTVEINNDAETGNQQMHGMLIAMDEINDASGSISKIIKVIDDIAFQTNILALNAAVEAARAGQHGKGFAVVAEEVRNLAVKSANAANETTKLIQGSIGSVEKGTVIARETAAALDKIVAKVAKAADLIGEIASASEEQAGAIEQFNQGLTQVSQVVQNTVAISEESAAASEELSNQADALKEKTAFYTVDMNRAEDVNDGRLSGQKQKTRALPLHRITLD